MSHFFGSVRAGKCHQGPECDANAHNVFPVVPVAQVSKEGSQEHVATDKNWKKSKYFPEGVNSFTEMNSTVFLKTDLHNN